jgi:hypothetical protein
MATNQAKKLSKFVKVSLGGEEHVVAREDAVEVMDALHQKHGGKPTVEDIPDGAVPRGTPLNTAREMLDVKLTEMTPVEKKEPPVVIVTAGSMDPVPPAVVAAAKKNSEFGGELVMDDEAKKRIEGQHDALRAAGVNVDTKHQFYATGTRMADVGYQTQAHRKQEHEKLMPFAQAAEALAALVQAENRHDETMTARDLAKAIEVKVVGNYGMCVTAFGHLITEQALRGLMSLFPRAKALGYTLGLTERAAADFASADTMIARDSKLHQEASELRGCAHADLKQLAHVLQYECTRWGDRTLKLRMRKNPADIFAIVTPSYAPADAPEVIKQLLPELPKNAKGSFAYDGISTQWELRGEIFTPTPVEEQAVGEPFRGYSSFQARDNGTSRCRGGGGVELLACLNASVYIIEDSRSSRVHRGNIMLDIAAMVKGAQTAFGALCKAWGQNRAEEIQLPEVEGKKLTIQDAIPGFYRYMLTNARSEVRALMKGSTEKNVEMLSSAYFEQRRDSDRLIRSDLAQGMTWAIQDLDSATRRDAEAKIGNWLVKNTARLQCELRESEDEN